MQVMSGPPSVGDIIHDLYLKPSAISVEQAAHLCTMEAQQLQSVIDGDQAVTYEVAQRLAQGFNTAPSFWLNLYRDWLAEQGNASEQRIHQHDLVALARTIVSSYQRLLGQSLLGDFEPKRAMVERLYHFPGVVLAHDGGGDPRFTYANRTAQTLWQMEWNELVGMPSRFSAEPDHRDTRAELLQQVGAQGYIDNYAGIRISKTGRRFRIENATVFNLLDADGTPCGQAATFNHWTLL